MLPKAGEVWWVRNPGAITLYKAEVLGITEKVVSICEYQSFMYNKPQAYKIADIEFVEKIKDVT